MQYSIMAFIFCIFIFPQQALSKREPLDVSDSLRCDTTYQFDGCTGGSADLGLVNRLKQKVGINLKLQPPAARPIPKISGVINTLPPANDGRRRGGVNADIGDVVNTNGGGTPQQQQQAYAGSQPQQYSVGGNSRVSPASVAAPGVTASGTDQIRHGMIYADDEAETTNLETPEVRKPASALDNLPTSASALMADNSNKSSGNRGTGAAFRGAGGGAGLGGGVPSNPHGDYEAGGGSGGKSGSPLTDGIMAALKSGEGFFGAIGSMFGGGGSDLQLASAKKGKGKGKAGVTGLASSELDKDKINSAFQKGLRSFASNLEFAGKNSFLFGSMCQHYVNYSRKNRIPNDKAPCPTK